MNNVIIGPVAHRETAPRPTRTEAKAETRRRVLEAADAAFRRDGYHGASLERIAADAGFTTGAIYSTFDSKAGLMLALVERRAERRRALWMEVLAAAATVEDFVTELARRGAREGGVERDWWALVIEFTPVIARNEELRARYAEIRDESLSALAAAIHSWTQKSGERGWLSPRRLAAIVTALNRGLALEGLVAPSEMSEDLMVDAHMILLRGVQAGEDLEGGR